MNFQPIKLIEMRRIAYKLRLLTDVILSSESATEGVNDTLSYIPGSKFLGIVASRLYDVNNEMSLTLFHNGGVRFGDAHIMGKESRSFKIPANWLYNKGGTVEEAIYIHEKMGKHTQKIAHSNGLQLKKIKEDIYFTMDGEAISPNTHFSIKSAYDSEKKRSGDAQLYGYQSLQKGSIWIFYIDFIDENLIDEVNKALLGKNRIGRSRSAEYGLIEISKYRDQVITNDKIPAGEVNLYADSNLCFYDDNGISTAKPTVEQLLLPKNSEILWSKSQIKTRVYQTWNRKRYNRDADRMIIEKGSVFVVNLSTAMESKVFFQGVGSHLSEGFGQLIANPSFFNNKEGEILLKLKRIQPETFEDLAPLKEAEEDNDLLRFLENVHKLKLKTTDIDADVNKFVDDNMSKYKGISTSQWGQIRTYAKFAESEKDLFDLLFDEKVGYLMHGKSESNWRIKNRRSLLQDAMKKCEKRSCIEFTIKLASEMAKENSKN